MRIRICPSVDGYHHASYLLGLSTVFGSGNIQYTYRGFPVFAPRSNAEQGDDLAFIVNETGLKVFIDQHDTPKLSQPGLAWCDVYGKVNLDPSEAPAEHAGKLVPLGPTFPARFCGALTAAYLAIRNYCLAPERISIPRRHFAHWRTQYKRRLPLQAYAPAPSVPDYTFFSASLWSQMNSDDSERCNFERARFIDACRSLSWLRLEGGFDQVWKVRGFEQYKAARRPSHREYVAKIQKSCAVFNSPSRLGCHGWKIAEFLALGKAIISTPLQRELPAPLRHGQHIHFVEPTVEAIRDALVRICRDESYRQQLERGARGYFEEYLQPERVLRRLVAAGRPVHAKATKVPLDRDASPYNLQPADR